MAVVAACCAKNLASPTDSVSVNLAMGHRADSAKISGALSRSLEASRVDRG